MLNVLCSSPEMDYFLNRSPPLSSTQSVFGGGKPWGIYGVFDLLVSTVLSDFGVLVAGDSTPYTPSFNKNILSL